MNYRFYFSFEKNQEFALEKYGTEIEKPNLTFVIGSVENVDHTQVIEALRVHEGIKINIIDYDTIVSTYFSPVQ